VSESEEVIEDDSGAEVSMRSESLVVTRYAGSQLVTLSGHDCSVLPPLCSVPSGSILCNVWLWALEHLFGREG
jgi:hypothetical protein